MVNTRKKSYIGSGDEASQANECSDSSTASATKRTTRRSVGNAIATNAAPQTPKEIATPLRKSRRLSNSSIESLNDTPVPAKSLARRSLRAKHPESGDESSDLEVLVIKRRRIAGNKDAPTLVPITEEKPHDSVVVSMEEASEVLQVKNEVEDVKIETISEVAEDEEPNINKQEEDKKSSPIAEENNKPEVIDLRSPPPVQVCQVELSPKPTDGRTSANSEHSADSFKSIESPKNEANQTAENIHLVLETSIEEDDKQVEDSGKEASQSAATSIAEEPTFTSEQTSTDEKKPEESEQLPVSDKTAADENVSHQEVKTDVEKTQGGNDGNTSKKKKSITTSNVRVRLHKLPGSKQAPKNTGENNNAVENNESEVPNALDVWRNIPRGKSKSGRTWKPPKTNPRYLYQDKGRKMGLEKMKQLRQERQRIKELENRMKEEKQARLAELARRRELNKKREEENARRGEVVQVIRNTNKLKRMKKKQLRLIQKRDTTGM